MEALAVARAPDAPDAEVRLAADVNPGLAMPLHFAKSASGCADEVPRGGRARTSSTSSRGRPEEHANGCAPHAVPELPAFLAPLLENLEAIDPIELDARLRRALRIEQRLLSEIAPLLLEVARSRAYRRRSFPNLAAFAREQLGMSPRKAQALLRLERAGELCSELRAAFRGGELSWVQAHALVPILALEHAQSWRTAWVAHAAAISVRRLEDDVERAIATGCLDPTSLSGDGDAQTGAHPTASGDTIQLFFTAPADVARVFKAVLATVQRRIERRTGRTASESEALDAMLEHCFAAWSPEHPKIPSDHRVFERDGWRCTVPGCTLGPRARRASFRAAAGDLRSGRADRALSHGRREPEGWVPRSSPTPNQPKRPPWPRNPRRRAAPRTRSRSKTRARWRSGSARASDARCAGSPRWSGARSRR